MDETSVRDQVLRAVEKMSADVTFEDVMDLLYVLQKVERGRRQITTGEGVSHDDAKRLMKRWRE